MDGGLQAAAVAELGAVVAATFAACWAPYLTSPAAALEVLQVGSCQPWMRTVKTVSLEDPSSLCLMLHHCKGLVASSTRRACDKGSRVARQTQQLPAGDVASHVHAG